MFTRVSGEVSGGRAGVLETAHGAIPTPAFMPVATRAALRTLDSEDLDGTGTRMVISNAFLLRVRPGNEILSEARQNTWKGTMNKDTNDIITSITFPKKYTFSLLSGAVAGNVDVWGA